MMRHMTAITSGLAVMFIAPGTLLGNEDLKLLEVALEDTLRALEVVTGVQENDSATPSLVKALTEAPSADAHQRDARLLTLRDEVSLLQMELDALQGLPMGFISGSEPSAPTPPQGSPLQPAVTTGMSSDLRSAIERIGANEGAPQVTTTPSAHVQPIPEAVVSTELEAGVAYSADPVAEARACYRAKRYDRGLKLLANHPSDIKALYWKALILEQLERYDEAIAALKEIGRLTGGTGYDAERAKTDQAFLEWKRDFTARMKASKKEGSK